MSFSPVIPFGGFAGWSFLKRTMASQQAAFGAAPDLKRDEDYFRTKIGDVKSATDLVSDRRLLGVALGAYGLDDDINNRFFISKVLSDGTLDPSALANRLADKQYRAFSAGFGFGDYATPRTRLSDFADKTLAAYRTRQFESAVGAQNENLRLALNAERELGTLAQRESSEDTLWFTVMGSAPLRKVFETALGLPGSFASLDLDKQLEVLKDKTTTVFGDSSIKQFSDPDKVEALNRRFLFRSEALESFQLNSPASIALQLLQSAT
jgi:hypothetical protein